MPRLSPPRLRSLSNPRLRSLGNKLALLFSAIIAIAFAGVLLYVVPQLQSNLEEQALRDLRRVAQVTSDPLDEAMGSDITEAELNELVRAVSDRSDARVMLLGVQRSITAPGRSPEAPSLYVISDSRVEPRAERGRDLAQTAIARDDVADAIAREAGVSKALLYHYFPSKADFFEATLRQAAEEIAARTEPDPDLPPAEALAASLGAFLEWIEENEVAYRKLMQSATTVGEARTLIEEVREHTARRLLDGLDPEPSPKVRTAVRAWLWFMDGACLDWLDRRDMTRDELRDLLMGTLMGALVAAGAQPPV